MKAASKKLALCCPEQRRLAVGARLASDLGLTPDRWQVLDVVYSAAGPISVTDLARNLGEARRSVQRIVKEMVWDQLLTLSTNAQRPQTRRVAITLQGEASYAAATIRLIRSVRRLSEHQTANDADLAHPALRAMPLLAAQRTQATGRRL